MSELQLSPAAPADLEQPPAASQRRPLLSYVGLILYKTYADLRAESERTFVGFLWWIGEPLVNLAVYYVVFELVFNRGMVENYAFFLFVGLVPWRWLSGGIMHGSHAIRSARGLMQLVYLPKLVFPIVMLLTDTVKFLVIFVALIVISQWLGTGVGLPYLALPLVLLVQALFILGVALVVAAVTPFFPDLFQVLENVLRLWFFLSGIFYPIWSLPEEALTYFRLNPMLTVIDSYRRILLWGQWPELDILLIVAGVSLVLVVVGAGLLIRNDYLYPKLAGF